MIPLKHRLEYGALRAIKALVNLLPYRVALGLGWALAILGFYGLRFRRAEAIRRIRQVFGDSGEPGKAGRIAWEAFRNLIFTAIESMRGERIDDAWIRGHVENLHLFETLRAQTPAGQGAILALPHMGSWELAGALCRVKKLPLFSIAALQKNPLFNAYLNQQRERSGIEILMRGDVSFRVILRNLKQGKYFAILPDVRAPAPALPVPFLGFPANIGAGMALFARQAQVPIFPCILTRRGWSRHSLGLYDPIMPDPSLPRDEDLLRMTKAVFACFDKAIRENPGQWFWYNKRWILDPVEPSAASPKPLV